MLLTINNCSDCKKAPCVLQWPAERELEIRDIIARDFVVIAEKQDFWDSIQTAQFASFLNIWYLVEIISANEWIFRIHKNHLDTPEHSELTLLLLGMSIKNGQEVIIIE